MKNSYKMKNIQVFDRPIGEYKTIQLSCRQNKFEYLEVTKYPDGDIVLSFDDEKCVFLDIEQLELLVKELKK